MYPARYRITSREWVAVLALGVATLLSFAPFIARATGLDADNMCDPVYVQCRCGEDPDPMTGVCTPGGKNKFMCPPSVTVCSDNTNGHITTGTCDRPRHCLTNTCGGTECKQVKPGEQPQAGQQGQQPNGQDQQGQQGQQGQGQPPQMPQIPKGGGSGGGQPQSQPEVPAQQNCAFSQAFNISCPNPVSTQLGSPFAQGSQGNPLDQLQQLGQPNASAQGSQSYGGSSQGDTAAERTGTISSALTSFWKQLTGQNTEVPTPAAEPNGEVPAASNSTFAPPPTLPNSYTPEQRASWTQNVVSWFQGLFR